MSTDIPPSIHTPHAPLSSGAAALTPSIGRSSIAALSAALSAAL
eukprot:CAMPEP_0174698948 /NCGR_PEP_ID=MMETSP1094-20130205/4390_1 /TAXON_ID=156173 /ORGANISM="Chrysochromulina brevifilum, Strain UTEX LB 985" /LENGTH=43 /DNA_ID= /DNA_START= /DNA_END= /DNA_ORIENTATION=